VREQRERPYACIKRGRRHDHRPGPQNWLLALAPGGLGRLCCGRLGGEVSGDCGQLRVGPRRERLAYPQVEFVLGQHALHERGLESADHLLAVGVRCPLRPRRAADAASSSLGPVAIAAPSQHDPGEA
jgi:hypothetical protein